MPYVDGFVLPVPSDRKAEYLEFSAFWAPKFRDWGALAQYECWGDDVPEGQVTDFRRAVDLQLGETVVFAWNIWPDKDTRDAAWARMREEPDVAIPFDGKRMIMGGFDPIFVSEKD